LEKLSRVEFGSVQLRAFGKKWLLRRNIQAKDPVPSAAQSHRPEWAFDMAGTEQKIFS